VTAPYPVHREADVALRDGSTVHVRPVRPEDRAHVLELLRGLSDRSRWFRFFSGFVDLEKAASLAVDVDYRDRFGLVATHGPAEEVVAHAMYVRESEGRAEIALVVADSMQGRGLGTLLVGQIAEAGAENGITILEGRVLPENHGMIRVFRDAGFPVSLRAEPGEVLVEFPTSMSQDTLARFEQREELAAEAALRRFLAPSAVAVVGAGGRGTVGGEVLRQLVEGGFRGRIYPVNARVDAVRSLPTFPSVLAVPDGVDLAIVALRADRVARAVRECGERGIRAVVVLSAGFGESGGRGARRQSELLEVCRQHGVRLIGPNSLGVLNTDPEVRLLATAHGPIPPPGPVGIVSQSGAVGSTLLERAAASGLGVSSFVSTGNKADISGNDVLQFWERDAATRVIALYLESFGNPRKFARITRRIARTKPIVAVKSGRTTAGARAATSHTGSVSAGSYPAPASDDSPSSGARLLSAADVTVDALFGQAGVIRTDTLAELFDVALLLGTQPLPAGNRVAVLTNAGGLGVLAADACERAGLSVDSFTAELLDRLRAYVPRASAVTNPIDLGGAARADDYRRVAEAMAAGVVDALIAIVASPLASAAKRVEQTLMEAVAGASIPIPVVLVGPAAADPQATIPLGIPRYAFPEDAVRALGRAAEYAEWRRRPEGGILELPGVRRDEATGLVAGALRIGSGWLARSEAEALLACYGIVVSDQAGTDGAPLSVGMVHDPQLGPILACGGGPSSRAAAGVVIRLTPLTTEDAASVVRALRAQVRLGGVDEPSGRTVALEDLLLRLSALVEAHPEVAELDCGRVLVHQAGVTISGPRVRVEVARPPRPVSARRV
jgi:acyl-CoA synthetase (NDP forming)/GNAT superfamily N-acetyltransferase